MNKDNKLWHAALEEIESETAYWAQFSLHPVDCAKHFAPWEVASPDLNMVFSGGVAEVRKLYPYIEGCEEAIRDALHWMKTPPLKLSEGMRCLASGQQPDDLFAVFKLYGDFREHLGVLYARDSAYAGFGQQRKSGQKDSQHLKRFAASFMEAVARDEKLDRERNISVMRHRFVEFVRTIVIDKKPLHPSFADINVAAFLRRIPRKMGQRSRDCYVLQQKYEKELTAPKFVSWVDEVLVFKIQEYATRP